MPVRLKSGRIYRRTMSEVKTITSKIRVGRSDAAGMYPYPKETGKNAFIACVSFATGGFVKLSPRFEPAKLNGACGYGKNPRKAIASAMRKAASHVASRKGAFAKFAGYSKSNRRNRRARRAAKRRY
jgi:hypothetical protein